MALCIVFDIAYIISTAKNRNFIGLIVKTLAALCFITIGYLGYKNNNNAFNSYILLGLILDGFGDLLLAIRNIFAKNIMFILGTISFLSGHIVFIRALFSLANNYLIEGIIGSVLIGALLFYLLDRICRFNKVLTVLGISYMIIISMMVCLSVGIYLTNQTVAHLVFMMGAVLFISSDIILVIYNFSKKEKWMHTVYSLAYFTAQILISYSLFL